ncbi:CPBP family intramembrane metalloprotease [Actinomadura sp. KC345]|uniref:CPBP family glutamic-type intramembrane protease n=1 Tax=Actinomadura sp. KC345 TaxID=2530371 RepID=UPI0010436BCD|nr:CPBP family glutamic-type intramembrane protease [Actinomadura sp. KC345]TDC57914.1 CPBP family intramembrane metalloprotease [Actinomadura sp. KC345]
MIVITLVIAALMGILAGQTARKNKVAYKLLPLLRPRHILTGIASVVVTFTAIVAFMAPGWTILNWGWWSAVGGVGNMSLGQTQGTGTAGVVIGIAVLTAVLVALPALAMVEELQYRAGAENQTTGKRIRRAVAFGFVHMIVGVPVAAALALSIAGGVFTWVYLRGVKRSKSSNPAVKAGQGLADATLVHTVHNVVAVGAAAVVLLLL